MTTLKQGSKGDEVKTLQKLLNEKKNYGIAVDGIFGIATKTAVENFQYAEGLSVDGIVGPKTWAALGITDNTATNSKCIDPSVIYKPLSVHITKATNRKPQYLAIHYTAGGNSKAGRALNTYNTFVKANASADFAVDDHDMVQFNPDIDNYYCWAVGGSKNPYSKGGSLNGKATNKNTISIEICSTLASGTSVSAANHSGWSFTDAALDNAVKLAKIIMKKYNIPIDRVIRHYDVTGKLCPGIIGWNDEAIYDTKGKATKEKSNSDKWLAFKKRLS